MIYRDGHFPIEGRDYAIRLVEFPNNYCKACVVMDENGFFNIYVNDKLSNPEQLEAINHEIEHIYRDHFYSNRSVRDIENEMSTGSKSLRCSTAAARYLAHQKADPEISQYYLY